MTGSEELIDLGLSNVWKAWFAFRKGKRMSDKIHDFQYHLESRLLELLKRRVKDRRAMLLIFGMFSRATVLMQKV